MDNNNIIHQARYLMKSNWIQALQVLEEALKKDPKDIDILSELADIYADKGSYKTALEYLQKAIKFDPKNATIRFKLANMYLELEQPALALSHYDKIENIHPEALFNKALSYYYLHQLNDAIDTLKECVASSTKLENAYFFLIELLLMLERTEECYVYINETKKNYGESPQLSYFLASNYEKENKWLPAYNEYLKALPGYKDNPKLYRSIAVSAENIGQIERAIYYLKEGIQVCRKDKKLVILLVKIHLNNNLITCPEDLQNMIKDFDKNTVQMILNYYYKMIKD